MEFFALISMLLMIAWPIVIIGYIIWAIKERIKEKKELKKIQDELDKY